MSKNEEQAKKTKSIMDDDTIKPIDWHHARPQARVRPQWDPQELANQLLDEMEKNGRLPFNKRP